MVKKRMHPAERITLAYRRIPESARSWWSMGSSSSGAALIAIREAPDSKRKWQAFTGHCAGGAVSLPFYAAGAALRRLGLAGAALAVLPVLSGVKQPASWDYGIRGGKSLGWGDPFAGAWNGLANGLSLRDGQWPAPVAGKR